MPAMLIMGGLTIAGGLSGRKSGKKLQKEALAIQRETLNFNKQRYKEFKELYGDIEKEGITGAQELNAKAKKGVHRNYQGIRDEAATSTTLAFDKQKDQMARQQERFGVNPNSGRFQQSQLQMGINQALAEADAINKGVKQERQWADDADWNRQMQAAEHRRAITGMGVAQSTGAAAAINNSSQELARTYSNAADRKFDDANQWLGVAGNFIGKGISGIGAKPDINLGAGAGESPLSTSSLGLSDSSLGLDTQAIDTSWFKS